MPGTGKSQSKCFCKCFCPLHTAPEPPPPAPPNRPPLPAVMPASGSSTVVFPRYAPCENAPPAPTTLLSPPFSIPASAVLRVALLFSSARSSLTASVLCCLRSKMRSCSCSVFARSYPKFSKVSALVHLLCKASIESTFENVHTLVHLQCKATIENTFENACVYIHTHHRLVQAMVRRDIRSIGARDALLFERLELLVCL